MNKPVIAAVNGPAIGFGSTMLLPMDYRFASRNAIFGFVFTRRGLMPEGCATWLLPKVVGIYRAIDWVMSGRHISVEEAQQSGFVHQIVEADQLLATVRLFTINLLESASASSLMFARRAMWGLLCSGPEQAHRLESFGMSQLKAAPDFKEAIAAFREKRASSFTGLIDHQLAEGLTKQLALELER